MDTVYKINNLCKYYGEGDALCKALDDVSLEIYKGEMLCILGESGSGKSTLLNILGGIDKPDSGEIIYKNQNIINYDIKALAKYRREEIGFIFQFFNLLDELNVYQNLTLIPGSNNDKNKINDLLNRIGVIDSLYKYPRQLSGGQQQRVSIARVLNKPSNVIIADEPTGALDDKSSQEILKILEKLHKDEKRTIIIVTHNTNIAKICDRIVYLKSGKIVADVENFEVLTVDQVNW